MIRFLMEAGPFIWPIILLSQVIGILVLWNILSVWLLKRSPTARRHSVDAVLFWGCVAALLGFLGQWMGIHNLSQAVIEKGIASPRLISIGISESLLTPIAGMVVLIVAALLWFLLRVGLWSVERKA